MAIEITGIDPRTNIDRLGMVAQVDQVRFKTEKGVASFIRVPRGVSNEVVRDLVRQAAEKLDDLMGEVAG